MITDRQFLDIAQIISSSSHAERDKVGAILVKNGRIISLGYNGTPNGFDNSCELDGVTRREVLHAEANALTKCACSHESSTGAVLYTTMSPCLECAKLIIQCQITKVIYRYLYFGESGIGLLWQANIEVHGI